MKSPPIHAVFLLLIGLPACASAADVAIRCNRDDALARFAVGEIRAALAARGDPHHEAPQGEPQPDQPSISLMLNAAPGKPESFRIRREGSGAATAVNVTASDPGGLLYGALELAEQIRLRGLEAVTPVERAPHFALRGVKFNLPLDVRTPSYSDMSDSAQANIATVWDFDFWREFLDTLARHRYNFVSLWNLHPFPSLVRVPEYPDVGLDDVWRSTFDFAEDYSTRATDIVTPAMLAPVETVRRMTMDEKIAFWRRVMEYGRDRNIEFYVVTWNIYTYGTGGRHGITDAIDNPTTIDYFRRSVAALLRTHSLLRGIGVTAGENIGDHDSSFEAKEDWLLATYGQGVLDVAREQPERTIRFIHRQHETSARDIAARFAPLLEQANVDFVFSFKYAQAHVMSSTTQPFHHEFVDSLGEQKTLWTLRNDDALMLRWGAPDFVRTFIRNMPAEVTQGVYYGSDMWIWGREFLSLHPAQPRQLEIAKHWFNWMLWGRLAYDPALDTSRIAGIVRVRFAEVDAARLVEAWQHASMTYPLTTGFHWGRFDFQWYIEACRSRPGPAQTASGFHDVNRFITLPPHPGTDNVSIPEYVEAVTAEQQVVGTTPLQVAAELHEHASAALAGVDGLDPGEDEELRATLEDIRAMAWLGEYYGAKITGATELALFRRTGDAAHQRTAIAALERAAEHWRRYTAIVAANYRNPVWTNRVGLVDWTELTAEVEHDIAIARDAKPDGAGAP